jgi:sterol desaturase/sphingolipid hydroxylase (fatty acid hydroxylase superfamily)
MTVTEFFVAVWPRIVVWDVGRYVVAACFWAAIVALIATSRWKVRRIQDRRPSAADYRREILASLRTCLVFSVIGLGIVMGQSAGVLRTPPKLHGFATGFLYLAAMMVGQDAYFYWTHRAMHHRALFRWFHKVHHQSITPTPFAAYAFNISEAIVQALFVVLWVILLPTPQLVVMTFMVAMILRNTWGHAGYEIHPAGLLDHPIFGKLTTTLHHDLHHSGSLTYNYGLWFTWWDRWMGTEHPHYRERYRALTAGNAPRASVPASLPAE